MVKAILKIGWGWFNMKLFGYIFLNNLRPYCPYDDSDFQVLSYHLIDSGCILTFKYNKIYVQIFSSIVRWLFILYSS